MRRKKRQKKNIYAHVAMEMVALLAILKERIVNIIQNLFK
jgi:hypothetical protein